MSDERGRGGEASAGIADANEVKPSWHRVKIYITHRPTLNSCCIRSRSTSERKRGCIIHIFTYRPFPRLLSVFAAIRIRTTRASVELRRKRRERDD